MEDIHSHFLFHKSTTWADYIYVCLLGWAQWNLSRFEFKFDDTRLSSKYKNKIGSIKFFVVASWRCSVSALLAISDATKLFLIRPILFLYYEENLVSSNLNSNLLRFHCAHPNNQGLYLSNLWNILKLGLWALMMINKNCPKRPLWGLKWGKIPSNFHCHIA